MTSSSSIYNLGPRGETLIKSYEKLKLIAYMPTPQDKPTIGFGHTKGVKMGMTCNIQQAQQWFLEDTSDAVLEVRKVAVPLTQSMFDALVSLVFNAGASSISVTSTIGKALRSRSYYLAWAGFTLWRKQARKDLLGLARRRGEEMSLFLEDGMPQ